MTPPDMESIIAAVLAKHEGDYTQDDWWICCSCGAQWMVGEVHYDEAKAQYAAHHARAVLAALEQAGFGKLPDDSTLSRVEVINKSLRQLVEYPKRGTVTVARQDDGRTIKIFIKAVT